MEIRHILEALEQTENGAKKTLAYFEVNDNGSRYYSSPSVLVTILDTGDDKQNDKMARKVAVEQGFRDLNTGFYQLGRYSVADVESQKDEMMARINSLTRIIDIYKNQVVNTATKV
jgi:hypothetical protein